jgi:hypothetical protein
MYGGSGLQGLYGGEFDTLEGTLPLDDRIGHCQCTARYNGCLQPYQEVQLLGLLGQQRKPGR